MSVMSQILSTLYVGSETDSIDVYQLKENKVTHIVRLHVKDEKSSEENDIEYYRLEIMDLPDVNIRRHFEEIFDFIHGARLKGYSVLIHCGHGISRSVAIATAYAVSATDVGLREMQHHIKLIRPQGKPNEGFQKQLEQFGNYSLKQERERMRTKFAAWSDTELSLRNQDNTFVRANLAAFGQHVRVVKNLILATRDDYKDEECELEGSVSGVTHVVRIEKVDEEVPKKSSIIYHSIQLKSESPADFDLRQHVSGVNDFIHKARMNKARVLINCTSGPLDRASALIVAYLMSISKFELDDLFKHVEKMRGLPIGDMMEVIGQLREFQKQGLTDERTRMAKKFSLKETDEDILEDRDTINKSLKK